MSKEQILGAAIRLQDGTMYVGIFGGNRHGDLIAIMRKYGETVGDIARADQGFITNDKTFVDRVQAMKIARSAGQVRTTRVVDGIERTHEPTGDELFTEDLW